MRTWLDVRGIASASGVRPFFAGAMHYWRVAPDEWSPCLRAMHDAGLTLVETPVPWRVHEPARGDFDWTAERDLVRFVETARAAGLGVVLRLGPSSGAELTSFGVPDWVLAERACLAITSRGTPAWLPAPPRAFPIPSLASAALHAHLRAWLAQVAARVRPLLGAPIAAIAVERADFFRAGAYDLDYHADALAWFGGDPPRAWDPANAEACVRWVQFQDEYKARALARVNALLDEVGFAELARVELPPASYAARADLRDLAPGSRAIASIGCGTSAWLPPPDVAVAPAPAHAHDLDRDRALAMLAAGARGFDLVMAVERDRHVGAAIDRAGRLAAAWLPPLLAALAEVDWPSLHRVASIALVEPAADRRFGIASSLADPIAPALAELIGIRAVELGDDAGAIAAERWHTAVRRALELAQVPYAIVGAHAPADELAEYRAVIAPTIERVDRALWQALRELADARRTVVVVGPGTPVRDEFDRPLDGHARRMGRLEPGSLDDLAGLAAALAQVAGDADDAWQVERPSGVRTAVFADAAGAARVVFAFADGSTPAAPMTATLFADPEVATVRDALTGERLAIRDGRVTVPIAGARMLLPEP